MKNNKGREPGENVIETLSDKGDWANNKKA